ncbi:glycosyltransferase [Cytobacillus suaedae]|nr:glycosyltransferase [Cytobacillus suaedae]
MKLSICLITKNEEKNIGKCLEGVKSIANEIIVVDTGSTDDTISIAKQMGAKIFHFTWVDDFSKARNYAISKAKGDWIFFLDADEYISEASFQNITPTIRSAIKIKAHAISILVSNYEKEGNRFIISLKANKLFRKDSKIFYKGSIHETITYAGKGKFLLLDATDKIETIHTGYSLEDRNEKQKGERNLRLLFQELEKDPENGFIHFYISESLASIQKHKDALSHAQEAIELGELPRQIQAKNYRNIITLMISLEYPLSEIVNKTHEAINYNPEYPDLYYLLGNFLRKTRLMDAIEAYENVLRNLENALKMQSVLAGYTKMVFQSLGELYYKTEQIHRSLESHLEVLKFDRYDTTSLKAVMGILSKQESSKDIVNYLNKIYNLKDIKDLLVLLQSALQSNNKSLAISFFSLLNQSQQLYLQKESTFIKFLKGDFRYCSEEYKKQYNYKFDPEIGLLCLVSADLSNNKRCLEELMDIAKPTLKKLIRMILIESVNELEEKDYPEVVNLILQYLKVGHEQKVKSLLEIIPKDYYLKIADTLIIYEYYQIAINLYDEYLDYKSELSPKQLSDILLKMGECLNGLDQINLALEFWKNALELDPNNFRLYELMILAYRKIADYEQIKIVALQGKKYFPESSFIVSNI